MNSSQPSSAKFSAAFPVAAGSLVEAFAELAESCPAFEGLPL
jgi:hypothetical protein